MSHRSQSSGAYWTRWRYQFRLLDTTGGDDHGPWLHAPTLADIREEADGRPVEILKRNREGDLEPYAT